MAQITITFPASQAERISLGMQQALHLEDRGATVAEVKQYIVEHIKRLVRESELRAAETSARDTMDDVDLT